MSETPKILYHYTNQVGLLGILQRKKLWATHIHFLNDSKEFWHNVENTTQALQARLEKSTDHYEQAKLRELQEHADSISQAMTFVTSLSADPDSLSLWRGYVGNQPGFALGFDGEALDRLAKKYGARLAPCVYDQAEQGRQIDAVISETLQKDFLPFERSKAFLTGDSGTEYVDGAMGRIVDRINATAPLHKHPAFRDEKEWRFIWSPPFPLPEICFRPGQAMLIPYVEIDLMENNILSCLKEIVIGPCSNPNFSHYSLLGLLTLTKGIPKELKRLTSSAPYRYW